MRKMTIYEPAMCCSTGLCGVGVDTELLRVSTVISTLTKNEINVDRFNLTNSPQEFIANKVVNTFIRANGLAKFPITVLDGEITITGRYPSNDEFIELLEIPKNYL